MNNLGLNSPATKQQAYAITQKFVDTINLRDAKALWLEFGISNAVAEEIHESIDEYFEQGTKLSLAPEEHAFDIKEHQRPFIDMYETNDKTVGLECILFANGSPGEAILHTEISASEGRIQLHYKYIGS
ncbi:MULTISPECIES: hypothetical protein [Pseudomonas]|uniref:hypothetical protein n=1 Tax=Pseudomonas TaxID=286 RepID=UPI000B34F19D|nr:MULTISPECIES: hypothetical protein [Pseudomonas]PMY59476.1 hypothetical protein C1Y31_31680 [Pseudomonas sp. FW305-25]PMY60240.1 hypothetical protein C1Y32_31655 [Pseudomonas sp. FW126-L8]PNA68973.1 ribosomal-protein-alanine N-acetyltransferase [Pseudomonas sp. FW305-76]